MKGSTDSILETTGNTPIVRLNQLARHVEANIYGKLEYMNPGGSVKDRPALRIIEDAEDSGQLKPGGTIVEATSGNTGMGLAMAAAVKGYKTVFVMPDKMSQEKILSLRAFGSRVLITPTNVEPEDPRSYYSVARRVVSETPGAFLANQYHNPSNPKAHYLSTGPELWEQTGGEIDALVATMGTGGTISGIGKYLKEKNPNIKIIGVDPVGSIFYDYFRTGKLTTAHSYKVEGFGEDFIPGTIDFQYIDDVVRVTDRDCFLWTRRLVREEGWYCGGSSGGAVCGAVRWAERYPQKMNIVTIICDSATRYLSKIFDDNWMEENGFLEPDFGVDTVAELLEGRKDPVVTVRHDTPARDVVPLLIDKGISQMPVTDDSGKVTGIISEGDLLRALAQNSEALAQEVGTFAARDFSLVEPSNSVSVLAQLLSQGKVVIVEQGGRIAGIITKIDFIAYMTRRGNSQ